MELQLTEGTKKKSTECELKHKSMFSHFNTPLSRNTYRLQKGNEPSLITPGLIYEAHLDKIKSTHTTKGMFLFPKKKKKKDRQTRFCWPATTDHINYFTHKKTFWNKSTCSSWVNILYILNSFVIKCFSNRFTFQEVVWIKVVTLKTHCSPLSFPWDALIKKKIIIIMGKLIACDDD